MLEVIEPTEFLSGIFCFPPSLLHSPESHMVFPRDFHKGAHNFWIFGSKGVMLDNSELPKNARNVVIVFNNSNYKTKLVKIANDRDFYHMLCIAMYGPWVLWSWKSSVISDIHNIQRFWLKKKKANESPWGQNQKLWSRAKQRLFSSLAFVQVLTNDDISYNCTLPVCSKPNSTRPECGFELWRVKDSS